MGRPPRLDKLDAIIGKKEDFFLTDREYSKKTGANLPKEKSYLMRHSAFSAWLSEKDYVIVAVQEKPVIERTVHIRRRKGGREMKKLATVFVLLILSVCLTACNSKVKECEQLIENIGTLDTEYYFDSTSGKIEIDSIGIYSFEKADEFYGSLSSNQQKKVKNIDKLESQRAAYQELDEAYSLLKIKAIPHKYHNSHYTIGAQ